MYVYTHVYIQREREREICIHVIIPSLGIPSLKGRPASAGSQGKPEMQRFTGSR